MSIEAVADALAEQGFRRCKARTSGAHAFRGEISCHGKPVPIEIEIEDLDFVELPKIWVLERPEKLKGFKPHFVVGDRLCYANKAQVLLDRYHPAEYVAGCLKKASSLLEELSLKDYPNDTHEEFLAYWPGDPVLIDCPESTKGLVALNLFKTRNSGKIWLLSSEPANATTRLEKIGWSSDAQNKDNCFVIRSPVVPSALGNAWPPKSLADLFGWLRQIDRKTYDRIHTELANKWILKTPLAAFMIRTPTVDYGFYISVDMNRRKTYQRKPSLYRDYLLDKRSIKTPNLFSGYSFDPSYIHLRNTPGEKSLANRSVMVVGCGTIGGYLATYLARLGAGTRGRLILVDPDVLLPQNLGRHVLGMGALFQNKAEAIAELIRSEFPHLNVVTRPADVRKVKEILSVDLLLDATGEEALSMALNERLVQQRMRALKAPAALHVWIAGAGAAIQSLFVDSLDLACYRCLRIDHDGRLVPRFSVLKDESKSPLVRVGCDSFMPFPVSTSVQAASLALETVLDWLRGDPTPRLRTRVIDRRNASFVKDQDPEPLKGCLACRKK